MNTYQIEINTKFPLDDKQLKLLSTFVTLMESMESNYKNGQ